MGATNLQSVPNDTPMYSAQLVSLVASQDVGAVRKDEKNNTSYLMSLLSSFFSGHNNFSIVCMHFPIAGLLSSFQRDFAKLCS